MRSDRRRRGAFTLLSIGALLIVALSRGAPAPGSRDAGPDQAPAPGAGQAVAKGAGEAAADEAAGAGHYVKLELRTDKERYCRGEPIVVECRLVNGSETLDAQYFCMYGRYCNPRRTDLEFHIGVTQKGVDVGTTRFGSRLGGFSGSRRPFTHGDRDMRRVTISSIFDMTTTGEYRIAATIPVEGPGDDGRGWHAWLVRSEEIKVVVNGECP